jgi:hypothetical protein
MLHPVPLPRHRSIVMRGGSTTKWQAADWPGIGDELATLPLLRHG